MICVCFTVASTCLQFRQGTWADLEEVGISELKGAYRVTAGNINLLVASLQTELETAILQGEFENRSAEKDVIEQALTSLSSQATVNGLQDDIRVYIEVTIARSRIRAGPGSVVLLTTEDCQFFKIFAQSHIAENIFLSKVDAVMGRTVAAMAHRPNLRIVLAGEVVPGM